MQASQQEPEIIYEEDDFLAVNKPAGLLVHPVRNKPLRAAAAVPEAGRISNGMHGIANHESRSKNYAKEPTLVDWLIKTYPEIKTVGDDPALRPGIVHRLDKDTSGVMLVAKNQGTFEYLKSLFARREMRKEYIAVARGAFKGMEGTIDAPLGIVTGSTRRSTRSAKMAKPAVTEYRVLKTFRKEGEIFSVVALFPKTGRTHQLRAHLSSVGHPIVGDALYGGRKKISWAKRLMLHAQAIEFTAPSGTRLRLEAPLPVEFEEADSHA